MSILSTVTGTANNVANKVLSPLKNQTVSLVLTIILVLYSSLIAGNPPTSIVNLAQKPVVRVIAIFLLALLLSKGDREMAVMATVAVVITIISANRITMMAEYVLGKGAGLIGGVKDAVKTETEAVVKDTKTYFGGDVTIGV